MQVQITAERIPPTMSRRILRAAAQFRKAEGAIRLFRLRLLDGKVKLMPVQDKPCRTEYRILRLLRLHVADHLQAFGHAHPCREHPRHLMLCSRKVHHGAHEVHIAAAFGVDGHPRLRRCTYCRAQRRILR